MTSVEETAITELAQRTSKNCHGRLEIHNHSRPAYKTKFIITTARPLKCCLNKEYHLATFTEF